MTLTAQICNMVIYFVIVGFDSIHRFNRTDIFLLFTRDSALPLRIILETLFDLHALADKERKNPVNGSLSEGISGFFTMKIKNFEEKSGFKVSWSVCYSFRYYL